MRGRGEWFWFVVPLLLAILAAVAFSANITFDHRALLIDGTRRLLISGSIHYPRSTPEMWPNLIQQAKDGGLDVIDTYVFWDIHEPIRNQYDFGGRKDLVKFMKMVAQAGLFVHLRIGPYLCAEWNYGGFPVWLHLIPGIMFRTNNEPFKAEMQRFTAKIVDMMKKEQLYASQGGPIILTQIENEYGLIQKAYGSDGRIYINWAANMAASLNTGVPWVMCQQWDEVPDFIINTCNGFYCDQFKTTSRSQPKMWAESWSGWFLFFGGTVPHRPVEDLAFAVALFFQREGTFINYYMYHGGTNFARTSGGPFVATSYDYDAPIDEYGIIRQPKWGHLKDVHKAIRLCETAMVATDPVYTSLGPKLENFIIALFTIDQSSVYSNKQVRAVVYKTESGLCAAFLANIDTSDAAVNFSGSWYNLPGWSVSILPDCKNVVLNTAKVNSMSTVLTFTSQSLHANSSESVGSDWSWFSEPIGISRTDAFVKLELLEQLSTTSDKTDYMWYSSSIDIRDGLPHDGSQDILHVRSLGHAVHAFVNKKLAGSKFGNIYDPKVAVDIPITLAPGKNTIDLLSLTVGLLSFGVYMEKASAGITGPVTLNRSVNGTTLDLSSQQWTYQIGLKGEESGLSGGTSSLWTTHSPLPKNQPLTWYKGKFDAPTGNDPVAIDFMGMGKGEAWVNGQSIGRYWPTYISPMNGCSESCDYREYYGPKKCQKNCGKPSQQLYHVPRSWMQPRDNILVLFEEVGGDPTQISFATRHVGSLCSHVGESHLPPVDMWDSDSKTGKRSGPVLSLECPKSDQVISSVEFASFGTPDGSCGSFSHGKCSSSGALSIVQKACVGSNNCSISVSTNTFGDPCKGVGKSLAVEASCA